MATKSLCATLMLAVIAAFSLGTTAMAQQSQTLSRTTAIHDHRGEKPSGANVHDHRTKTPSRPNVNIHDHRGEKPGGATTPGGTRVPPPRVQPPRRSGPYVPPPPAGFTEASQLFSRHKHMRLTAVDRLGRDEPEFVSPTPVGTLFNSYHIMETTNGKFLGLERLPSQVFPTGSDAEYHPSWSAKRRGSFTFHRSSPTTIPIRYGEPLAMQMSWVTGERMLVEHSSYVLNGKSSGGAIRHSKKKSFEWALIGGTPGRQIRTGSVVVLYNLKRQQPLIYYKGQLFDVGWPDQADIKEGYQQVAKMRAAAKVLLMPGVAVGN